LPQPASRGISLPQELDGTYPDGASTQLQQDMDNHAAHLHAVMRTWSALNKRGDRARQPGPILRGEICRVSFSLIKRAGTTPAPVETVRDRKTQIRVFIAGWNTRPHDPDLVATLRQPGSASTMVTSPATVVQLCADASTLRPRRRYPGHDGVAAALGWATGPRRRLWGLVTALEIGCQTRRLSSSSVSTCRAVRRLGPTPMKREWRLRCGL